METLSVIRSRDDVARPEVVQRPRQADDVESSVGDVDAGLCKVEVEGPGDSFARLEQAGIAGAASAPTLCPSSASRLCALAHLEDGRNRLGREA